MKIDESREIWTSRVSDFKSSNLTQKAWCEKNDIKVSTLRYWIRKIRSAASTPEEDSGFCGFEFASVCVSEASAPALVMEINGVKLSIAEDFDEMLLIKLVRTLKKL